MPSYKDKKTGKWYCQFYYQNWRGERKHKVKRGFERKKDAEAWEREFLSREHTNDELTMDCIIEEYKTHINNELALDNMKATSWNNITRDIRLHIEPYFRGVKVNNVLTKDVNDWVAYVAQNAQNKEKLAPRTIAGIKSILNRIFALAAVNHGTPNPTEQATTMKQSSGPTKIKIWEPVQYKQFREAISNPVFKVIYDTMFCAGLRLGEVLALTPQDIAPYHIRINKSLGIIAAQSFITTPKTKTSNRTVEIPHFLYYEIKEIIDKHYPLADDDRIFPFSHSNVEYLMKKTAKQCGLPPLTPHGLRHSYASILYQITKDITLVANNLGHKSINVTLQTYSHMLPSEKRRGLDELQEMTQKNIETIELNSF